MQSSGTKTPAKEAKREEEMGMHTDLFLHPSQMPLTKEVFLFAYWKGKGCARLPSLGQEPALEAPPHPAAPFAA